MQHRSRSDTRSEGGRENELSLTVRKVMRQYFKDLDGEKACDIYSMVVKAVSRMEFAATNCPHSVQGSSK